MHCVHASMCCLLPSRNGYGIPFSQKIGMRGNVELFIRLAGMACVCRCCSTCFCPFKARVVNANNQPSPPFSSRPIHPLHGAYILLPITTTRFQVQTINSVPVEKVMTITSHKLSTDEICAGQEVE